MHVTDLRALRDKYEQMLRLRQLHARAKTEPDFVEPDPRPVMAALARLYPGALREIDELPVELITARIEELTAHRGRWLQVRPKAAHGRVRTVAFGAEGEAIATIPRGFYLRTRFTGAILADLRALPDEG